jgi:cytochrome P450
MSAGTDTSSPAESGSAAALLADPAVIACPYPAYAQLRQHCPVFEVPGMGMHLITRYDDIARVLRDPATFSSAHTDSFGAESLALSPPTDAVKKVMAQAPQQVAALLFTDDLVHRRHRELVQQAFSARRVAKLEESIAATTTEILDAVIPRGRVELMSEFAQRLPITVIADALGVPRGHIGTFTVWSDAIAAPAGRALTEPEHLECARHYVDFMAYFADQIAERRARPTDDLLTDLVRAETLGAEPLSDSELLTIVAQILTAGNHTTAKAIGFTMQLLLNRPGLMSTVRANPDRLADVIEESLRLESPVQLMLRVTTREVEIGGATLAAGTLVMLVFGSANHDDAVFPDPDTADIDRPNLRKHLAFSAGVHHCLGAALARAEIRVGLSCFLERAHNIRADGPESLEPSLILRGPAELSLAFEPAP